MKLIIKGLILLSLLLELNASSVNQKELYSIAIKDILKNKDKQKVFKDSKSKIIHETVGLYNIDYNGKKMNLLIMSTKPKDLFCHACAPYLSFFIFDGNKLVKSYINAFEMGAWGDAPSKDEIKIVKLNDKNSALLLKAGGTGQGWSEDYIFLYLFKKDKVDNVLKVLVSENNGGTGSKIVTDWNSTVKYKKGDSKFKDIIIDTKGVIKNKHINKKVIYKYNGKKYIKE